MWKEFKEFASKGSLLDMAIGIILGIAFGAIISSLVKDIVMPPIGLLLGKVDFNNLFVSLDGQAYASLKAAQDAAAPTINYGIFINTIIIFLITAFVLFLIVRSINRMRKPATSPIVPPTKECPFCLSQVPLMATRCSFCTSDLKISL
jgi:large conductance mechanosensitive channel